MRKMYYNDVVLRLSLIIAFLSVSLFAVYSQEQETKVRIIVKAPEEILVGEQFRVDYIIEGDTQVQETIMFKNMNGFKILHGPSVSTSSSVRFSQGRRLTTYRTTSTYYLEAQKEGAYPLPRAEIKVEGRKYRSDISKIRVISPKEKAEEVDAFVKTIISKPSVNVSDTLTLTYRLYTTKEIRRIISSDFPTISSFYSTNITRSRQTFSEEKINGRVYKVVDIRVLILQPQRVGQFVIPEGQIVLEYSTPTGRRVRDIWGDVYDEAIRSDKTLKIDSVKIAVQNLQII